MKGLLLKDFINIKGQWALYLLIIAMWFGVGVINGKVAFFSGVMQMLVVMLPLTIAAYDEKTGWEKFALTMPVTRRQMVFSRYLLVVMILIPVAVLSLAGSALISGNPEESLLSTLFSFPVGIMINCLMLPILFRFGVEKGRFVFIGAITVFILSGFLVGKIPVGDKLAGLAALPFEMEDMWHILLMFWAIAVICLAVSFAVSKKIYMRKDF